jgi:hypothetical protein
MRVTAKDISGQVLEVVAAGGRVAVAGVLAGVVAVAVAVAGVVAVAVAVMGVVAVSLGRGRMLTEQAMLPLLCSLET